MKLDLKTKLGQLYKYMSNRLHIASIPSVSLSNNKSNSVSDFGMTGHYNPQSKKIVVYVTSRHESDILRSFAHELIHHWQNERGQLNQELSPQYTQQNPHMRKKEMEAYLLGNILYRDWQDLMRYGSSDKNSFLVTLNENLTITDPLKFKTIVNDMIRRLVTDKIITSYNSPLSSGAMHPEDFIEDLSHKIYEELTDIIDKINDRGSYENQPGKTIQ